VDGSSAPGRVPVVLDVDTGVDDACAILLAASSRRLDLRAITCVRGNTDVGRVVVNTLTVLETCGAGSVPVAAGARSPLLAEPGPRRVVHGRDGMADLGLPAPGRAADPRTAVELLRDVLAQAGSQRQPATVLALGPLTNLALLLRTYPDVCSAGLARIVFVGGPAGLVGPGEPAPGDVNVLADPEAVAITLAAAHDVGVPVTLYGLDVFYDVRVGRRAVSDLARRPGAKAGLAAALLAFQCGRSDAGWGTIGDAGAVCAVLDPDGCRVRPHLDARRSRVNVVTHVDALRYARLFLDAVSR
jgi:pyrimidine-specific ribonucleoside hydrolase